MTAVVIFLSKYFSSAKENKKREKIDIRTDGIKVNNEKKVIYLLFATDPFTFISFFIEFLISRNIKTKKISRRTILHINKTWRLVSFNSIKLLSIKVKKVKKPIDRVNIKINVIIIFFLIKLSITYT